MLCVYRFGIKTDKTKALMTQIAVGKIIKSYICEQTRKVLFVIQFCPRNGAKATDAFDVYRKSGVVHSGNIEW